jgi:integrase
MLGEKVYMDLVARGKSKDSARLWRGWVDRFAGVCGEKDIYDRDDIIKYLVYLRDLGKKQNSINCEMRAIKCLAKIQGWAYPVLSMPKVKADDVYRPLFTLLEMEKLITVGREVLDAGSLAYLALSSIYGLRREEICTVDLGNSGNGHLRVDTLKGGNVTAHLIPVEIKGYLDGYKLVTKRSMTLGFKRIMRKVGMQLASSDSLRGEEVGGWHMIRRSLATELVKAEVSVINIVRFMRWSDSLFAKELGMLSVYAKKDQDSVDSEIFKVHPFLRFWK